MGVRQSLRTCAESGGDEGQILGAVRELGRHLVHELVALGDDAADVVALARERVDERASTPLLAVDAVLEPLADYLDRAAVAFHHDALGVGDTLQLVAAGRAQSEGEERVLSAQHLAHAVEIWSCAE